MPRLISRLVLMSTCLLLMVGYLAFSGTGSIPAAAQGLPTLNINDVTLSEGNSGTTSFTFTVALTAPAGPGGVRFDIATADNTATTAGSDYVAQSLTGQVIPQASSSYLFTVVVNGDTTVEVTETFFVNVTSITGANVGDAQGQGTITNDDTAPVALAATATCDTTDPDDLLVTITAGDGPFLISALNDTPSEPITVGTGIHRLDGPDRWLTLGIAEQGGDLQSINLGSPTCVNLDGSIIIPGGAPGTTAGTANPYPATQIVSGLGFAISDVNVTLTGLGHTYTDDVEILLVSPTGTAVLLMNDACGAYGGSLYTFTFDDEAAGTLLNGDGCSSGTYRPSSFDTAAFGAPAPAGPYGTSLSDFDGLDPNGTWSLFVDDEAGDDYGDLGSWSLDITSLPAVTVNAQDADAAEAGSDPGTFRITRTGPTTSALTVDYTLGGTAGSTDYFPALTGTETIPVGDTFVDVTINPVDDAVDEADPETLILTLTDTAAYDRGIPSSATINIADNDLPFFTIDDTSDPSTTVAPDGLSANVTSGEIVTVRTQFPLPESTTISLSVRSAFGSSFTYVAGSARVSYLADAAPSFNGDFAGIQNQTEPSFTFPAARATVASSTVTFDFGSIINNDGDFDVETLIIEYDLVPAVGAAVDTIVNTTYDATFDQGLPTEVIITSNAITLTIVSPPPVVVTANAQDASAAEAGTDPGTFRISRTGPTTSALSVDYTLGGTAAAGDYTPALTGTTSIPIGAAFVDVTITPVDDLVDEADPETLTLTLTDTAAYDLGAPSSATVNIADNDTAGVTITENDGTPNDNALSVTEGGGTTSFSVVLTSQPTSDVEVSMTFNDTIIQAGSPTPGASPVILTFTTVNWNSAQTVVVAVVNDDVDLNGNVAGLSLTSGSFDPNYVSAPFTPASPIVVTVIEDDAAGVAVTESGGTTAVTEGGAGDSYSVVLSSQPTSDVTVSISFDASQIFVNGDTDGLTTLVFTPSEWNIAQVVNVFAANDSTIEVNPLISLISHTVSSADPNYSGISMANVTASITDNDTASISFTTSGSTVSEAIGLVSSIVVRLDVVINGTPGGVLPLIVTAPITVTLGSAEADDLTLFTTNVGFLAGSFNGATVTVLVEITDDLFVEGDETATLEFGSVTSPIVASGTHSLTITDNDTAGFAVTESGGSTAVSEDGTTDTFTVVLNSQPLTDVVMLIEVALADQDEVSAAPSPLTFTNANWNVPQTVTVTGVDDAVADGDQIVGVSVRPSGALSDPAFAGLAGQIISVTNGDNDAAGFTVTESGGGTAVSEDGTTDTFTVVLNAQPLTDVVMLIEVALADQDEVSAAPTPLTFTNATWNIPQTVTVTGVDDAIADGDQIVGVSVRPSGALSDPAFAGLAGQIFSVTNGDNDAAGVTVTESGGGTAVSEDGATDTFTVVLNSQPTADVSIALTGLQVTTGAPALTFTPANWNTAQTVTVAAVDDAVAEGAHAGSVSFAITSTDALYQGAAIAPVTATITDNDGAGITVTESDGSTSVTEGGATDTFTVVLNSQPTADVSIALIGSQVTTGAPALTFTPANWNTAQTVTVAAVDDAVAEGAHAGSVSFAVTSADAFYNGAAVAPVSVAITDNDTAGVILTPPTIIVGEGGTVPATIQLGTQPSGTVVIQIIFDPTQTTINGETDGVIELTFTSGNWDTPVPLLIIALPNGAGGDSRLNLITIQIVGSTAPEYSPGVVSGVALTLTIIDVPPPPPTPLCEAHNFDEGGVVRSSIADALGHAINCRILYQNGASTTWLGGALYSEANLGVPGLLELGVQQAIDIFSPGGQTYFEGGAVFCLRGQGTLIWLAASGAPRVPAIIGSYTVPDFPGFTCATLFEPGTLVLVADNPVE